MDILFFTIISVLFITTVLLQQKSAGLGALGGADAGDQMVQTRRGADRFLHRASIVLGTLMIMGGIYFMAI